MKTNLNEDVLDEIIRIFYDKNKKVSFSLSNPRVPGYELAIKPNKEDNIDLSEEVIFSTAHLEVLIESVLRDYSRLKDPAPFEYHNDIGSVMITKK